MLIKFDIIKISYCGVGPVLGSAQNVHLISNLPEMMRLDRTLIICTLESMTNYGFKEKVKKRRKTCVNWIFIADVSKTKSPSFA